MAAKSGKIHNFVNNSVTPIIVLVGEKSPSWDSEKGPEFKQYDWTIILWIKRIFFSYNLYADINSLTFVLYFWIYIVIKNPTENTICNRMWGKIWQTQNKRHKYLKINWKHGILFQLTSLMAGYKGFIKIKKKRKVLKILVCLLFKKQDSAPDSDSKRVSYGTSCLGSLLSQVRCKCCH